MSPGQREQEATWCPVRVELVTSVKCGCQRVLGTRCPRGTRMGCHGAEHHAWGVPEGTAGGGLCRLLGACEEGVWGAGEAALGGLSRGQGCGGLCQWGGGGG